MLENIQEKIASAENKVLKLVTDVQELLEYIRDNQESIDINAEEEMQTFDRNNKAVEQAFYELKTAYVMTSLKIKNAGGS